VTADVPPGSGNDGTQVADVSAVVDQAVKEWLDRRTATARAAAGSGLLSEREHAKHQGIDDLRQRLDDYWYTLTPAILAALDARSAR